MKHIRSTWPALLAALALAACGGGNDGSAPTTPAVAADSSAPPAPPTAQAANIALTTEGTVAGVTGSGSVAFLGIPYAKPPVGALRWAPPQPPAAHDGTLQATAFGSACLQGPGIETKSSEDCLYLNVWKPANAKPGDKLPTLFYIHGGAFTIGSGAQGPAALASRGVVVVSINYRLGALGFLANKALRTANKDGSLGNFALMDELAALDWTRRNIAAFGGDASNVTVWGTSAGATQSFSLLQSPKAAGLFQRVVMQSGGSAEYSNPSMDSSLAVGDTAVAKLGCATAADVVACLRAVPTSALLAQGGLKWRPTVDNKILTQTPARAFETGNFNQVPVMIGGVYDEGTIFADTSETADNYGLYLHSLAPAGYDTSKLDAAYPAANFAVPAQGYARALGDSLYACANSARRTSLSAWVPVYGYEFVDPQLSFPAVAPKSFYYGSSHGMDSYYLTGSVDALTSYPYFDQASTTPDATTTAQRKALSEQAITYLLNFVRNGDPNGDGRNVGTRWPRFTGRADRTILSLTYPAAVATTDAFERAHQCDTVWGPGVFPPLY
ncbi:carboxylesterase/lipase family protein [Variovorax sp. UMC13]|uniref:carboxylesterase/lipase family protein n=1 Tax=Variovorax sp. UMC13 TaxID=1862326 RepID=UPI0016043D60|nr:carboxylesterase family protein [Variovorax sp. UMC13]MBB1603840.1 carboxylesterase [Variovorax sp. UMC13]